MSMGGSIGDVSIGVEVDASDAVSQIQKAASGPMAKAGAELGERLSKGIQDALTTTIKGGVAATLKSGLDAAGRAASAVLARVPEPLVSAFTGAVGSITSQLQTLGNKAFEPAKRGVSDFISGFASAEAAASSFTGKAGAAGARVASALAPGIGVVQNLIAGFKDSDAALSGVTGTAGLVGGALRRAASDGAAAWSGVKSAFQTVADAAGPIFSKVVSVASSAWEKIKSAASKAFTAVSDTMQATLTSGAKLAGAAVAGVMGTALAKGFSRLTAIDNAEASLRGLAATAAHVPEIMTAATNAVTGTAFGLGDAAKAAAQFAAAQVPVMDMERHLSSLANTAAAAGGDFDGMASIFSKVAARGNVTSEVLNQLTDRGISGLSALADYYGVTAEAAQAMVSNSEVSFDDFSRAMDAAMGEAAIQQATTFQGLMSNVGAALGRMGATAQRPIFDAMKAVMPGVISLLDQMGKAIAPLAELIGDKLAPAAEKLSEYLKGISFEVSADGASGFLAALGPLLPVIGGLLGLMGPLLASLPGIGPLFAGISGPVGLLAGALIALVAIDPATLLSGFESIAGALPGMVASITEKASELLPTMLARVVENAGIFITGIVNILTALIPALAEAIPQIVAAFAELLPQIIEMLLSNVGTLLAAALQLFQALIQAVITVLPQVVESLVAMLPQIATAIISALPQIITAALDLFMGILLGIVEATPVIIAAVLDLLPVLIESLLSMLPTIIESAIELFLGIMTGLVEAIPQILVALLEMLPQLISTLISMIPQLIQGAVQLFVGIVQALPKIIPQLIAALIDLAPVMISTLIGLIPQLIQAGVDLIGGLVQGLWDAASSIGAALINIAKDAIGGFLSFLGIKSPSRLFMEFGENTMQGYVDGMNDMAGEVDKAMSGIIPAGVDGTVLVQNTSLAPGAGAPLSPSSTITNNTETNAPITISGPDPYRAAIETADEIARSAGR